MVLIREEWRQGQPLQPAYACGDNHMSTLYIPQVPFVPSYRFPTNATPNVNEFNRISNMSDIVVVDRRLQQQQVPLVCPSIPRYTCTSSMNRGSWSWTPSPSPPPSPPQARDRAVIPNRTESPSATSDNEPQAVDTTTEAAVQYIAKPKATATRKHGRATVECPYRSCPHVLQSMNELRQHLHDVHNETVMKHTYPCNIPNCGYIARAKGNLVRHLRDVHKIGKPQVWPCKQPGCKYVAKRAYHLKEHESYVHNIGVVWHKCDFCVYRAKQRSNLVKHIRSMHDQTKSPP